MGTLVVHGPGRDFPRRVKFRDGQVLTIGSSPTNDIVLDWEGIAPRHARIRFMGLRYVLESLHSALVSINGQAVIQRRASVAPSERIEIGPFRLTFESQEALPNRNEMRRSRIE